MIKISMTYDISLDKKDNIQVTLSQFSVTSGKKMFLLFYEIFLYPF